MQTVRISDKKDLAHLKENRVISKHGSVVALGFFDGVHMAHRSLIKKARQIADKKNLSLIIFTFSGDDLLIKTNTKRLFTDDEKLSLLEECDADCTVIAKFGLFSEFTAESFVSDFLIDYLESRVAVCGYNFKFGKGAEGTSDTLSKLMKKSGAEAVVVEEFTTDGIPLSSTYIRTLLSKKQLRECAKLLGKPYFISGKVSHGLGLGKKMGIPTVNIEFGPERFVLPSGVYATVTAVGGKVFPSVTNVGVCPTFNERHLHAETFILNFSDNIYGENIRVYFIDFLRDEKKFSSAEELVMQINVDKNKTLELFGDIKWQELGLN